MPIIASIAEESHVAFSSRTLASSTSYRSCSAAVSGFISAIFASLASSPARAALSTSSARRRCAKLGAFAAIIRWKMGSSACRIISAGVSASSAAGGPAAAAASGDILGNTCVTFRSVSVLCWNLKSPAQDVCEYAPLSSW